MNSLFKFIKHPVMLCPGIFTRVVCCYLFIFLNNVSMSTTSTQEDGSHRGDKVGKIEGSIVLGGIFRISQKGTNNRCGETVEVEVGIQRAEAMIYAIKEINKDSKLLPNVDLGTEIRDSCNQETVALDESLKFILDSLSQQSSSRAAEDCMRNMSKDVVGVVGASRSSISVEVANLLRLFKVPQVSYASTSAELSNNNKFSYFARTVPPDTLQALAMLHIINEFNWTSVFTINSAGSYGEKGIEQFKKKAKTFSVCIVASEQITDDHSSVEYDAIFDKFLKLSQTTHVVVLFMKDNHVKNLLQSAKRRTYTNVTWIASDEWGTRADVVQDLEDFLEKSNAITITLPSPRLDEFQTYFKGLNGTESRDANPWFAQYWKQYCNSSCNTTHPYSSHYKFNDKLPYVIDAVYAFAHALHEMYEKMCPNMTGLCEAMKPVDRTKLRDHLFKVRFNGTSGNVMFNENGDSQGRYSLFHYNSRKTGYQYLGEWQNSNLNLTGDTVHLRKLHSNCSYQCEKWSRKIKKEDTPCCYRCLPCPRKNHQYGSIYRNFAPFAVNVSTQTEMAEIHQNISEPVDGITCKDCEKDERTNANYSGCVDLPHRYIDNAWVIIVSVSAGLGILSTLIVLSLFLYYIDTPLVKASGRDLMFPLLIGVLLSYIMTSFFVSKPTVVICGIQRFGIGFPFSICYASILIKTNRIARIFANQKLTKSVNFTKPHSQLVILALLIGIEAVLAGVGLTMKPPKVIKILPTADDIFIECNITGYDYAITFSYNFVLIILCTVYSFRTRKIPSSFNESKYLGFVMYTTCIIWIAFLPVYYGTSKDYKPIALSLSTTLSATTILVCLFGPKVYILIFRPSRNIQTSLNMTISGHSIADIPSTIPGDAVNGTNIESTPDINDKNEASLKPQNVDNSNSDVTSRHEVSNCSICEDNNSQDEHSVAANAVESRSLEDTTATV